MTPENVLPSALILPGLGNSGPEHWQSHWERQDPACTRLQEDWDTPRCDDWVRRLEEALAPASQPVVLAAHSAACAIVVRWAATAPARTIGYVAGALLVSPSDPGGVNFPACAMGFGPMPLMRLPFPSIVVTSDDDPYVSPEQAQTDAEAWGSRFVLLPGAGHINAQSGFGAWPEGYRLLASLRAGRDPARV